MIVPGQFTFRHTTVRDLSIAIKCDYCGCVLSGIFTFPASVQSGDSRGIVTTQRTGPARDVVGIIVGNVLLLDGTRVLVIMLLVPLVMLTRFTRPVES